jgi:hypothetical protein
VALQQESHNDKLYHLALGGGGGGGGGGGARGGGGGAGAALGRSGCVRAGLGLVGVLSPFCKVVGRCWAMMVCEVRWLWLWVVL